MTLLTQITPEVEAFIRGQQMFFVASAPTSAEGHINVSPKGLDTLRVLSPKRVAYLDLTGSGNETAAHVQENGRITIMFCAFTGKPNILRLYGRAKVIVPSSAQWEEQIGFFNHYAGARQIIACDIDRVQNSCGMAVPVMTHEKDRDALLQWAAVKGDAALKEYRDKKNRRSIDGIAIPLGE